jgi:hypothetical protein
LVCWDFCRTTSRPIEEQLARVYRNYQQRIRDLDRYLYLTDLQDRNETLFYRLLLEHITKMMPIISRRKSASPASATVTCFTARVVGSSAIRTVIRSKRCCAPGPSPIKCA